MSAGTLTLTNNSDAVTGSGTAFTTDLIAGDFVVSVVGGVTYSLPVKTVTSNTALVLAAPYQGPTQTKLAWSAVPFNTMNRVTAGMVTQATEALRGLNLDKQNWQSVFSAPGNITVELPDGSKYTGPSWLSVASQAGNLSALGIGGTGISLTALDWQKFDFVPGARYVVLSGNMTNVPVGIVVPGTTYQTVINVTGYDGSTRHVEVWYSTTTVANYYHYEVRIGGAPGSKGFVVRQIWTSSDVIPLANTAIGEIGLGIDVTPVITSIDWQQIEFKTGKSVRVSATNMTNAPVGVAYTAGTGLIITAIGKTSATRTSVQIVPDTVGGANYTITEVLLVGAPGARSFYTRNVLAFSDDDSGKLLGRQRLGFSDLGFGLAGQPITTNFDWQTAVMLSGQSWLLDASNMVNAPTELPNSGRLVAKVAGMSSTYVMLDVYEQPTSGAATGRRWYVYVGTYATAGSRGFTVRPLLTKADLDSRVGYAMLDFGTMSLSQRKVMPNPFGVNQPVEVVAETRRTDLSTLPQPRWAEPGWIYASGGYGVKASYVEGEGIVVQCGSFSLGNTSAQTGSAHQITDVAVANNLPVRVHVRKITS